MFDTDEAKEVETKKKDMRPQAEITLDFPVTVDATEYKTLTMRRPKTKDSVKAAKMRNVTEVERGILLLADLCGVAPNVIGELDEIDAIKLNEQLEAFRGGQSS
ncbi:phage tail assembly protein [Rhodopseudomonas palustris]|uniref:phage tail assembly protein n=1 Tax=Rhodopseudomonas palustris TaxID=1076 RepID=UPI000AAF96D1|nr:phage tail assembly protein [Rhodopseudomonas palustris]